MPDPLELQRIYALRFGPTGAAYRRELWRTLIEHFFQAYVPADATVLDLGCGYGEFINAVRARRRYGMDLNPATAGLLDAGVELLAQDCSRPWSLPDASLDVVFTSNFFEHLPDKAALQRTIREIFRCLKPGGQLIAVGPNIRAVPGKYWDFLDHHVILTERSLAEQLCNEGYALQRCEARFLPYTTIGVPRAPMWCVALYLKIPLLWRIFGGQFLVIARRPA